MHFRSLLTVYLPEITPDPEWEKEISNKIEELKSFNSESIGDSVMHGMYIESLTNISNAFARELAPVIRNTMERFNCCTEDKRFLEFEDRTEQLLADYNKSITAVRLPNGTIVEEDSRTLWGKYTVKDGLVYQIKSGPLHHPKRTKRAKKMTVLPDYPRRKLYKSFENYIEQECYAVFNEENGKYGEWYNPDGVFDWYSVGGRWPNMFLVKEDCKDYSFGETGVFTHRELSAPEGYKWVCSARKRDIQWDMMRQWRNHNATERFYQLKAMFDAGVTEKEYHRISEESVFCYGELVYRKEDTLEKYLAKYGIPDSWKYPIDVHDIFHNEMNVDKYSCIKNGNGEWEPVNWRRTVDEFIDDADDDEVFVGIDYHI